MEENVKSLSLVEQWTQTQPRRSALSRLWIARLALFLFYRGVSYFIANAADRRIVRM